MKTKAFSIILIISLVILIVSLSYHLTAFRSSLYPTAEQENIRNYLVGFDDLTAEMTAQEVSHLEDVKRVMIGVFIVMLLALKGTVVSTFYLRKDKALLLQNYKTAGVATIVSLAIISLVGLLSFNFLFTLFHQIFFPQGNWIFPSDSVLITLFPLSFFMKRALEIAVVSLLLASIFIGGSIYLERKK